LVTRKFLHSSLFMNFCIPHCPWIFVIFLHSSLGDAFHPCMRWRCWILSYDACELWISVNLDVGSNFCKFSHILAGYRMQSLMAAKSWLARMQPESRQRVTIGVAYVSVTGVN
jgi:hypothetical protein